jgi:hypothetical protein
MSRFLSAMLVTLALAAPSVRAEQTPNALKGVWKVVQDGDNTSPLPSLYIFTDKHYTIIRVLRPRPYYEDGTASDAEKLATFESFAANGGTYQVQGNRATIRPFVAKQESAMRQDRGWTSEFKVEGNSLWWRSSVGALLRLERIE